VLKITSNNIKMEFFALSLYIFSSIIAMISIHYLYDFIKGNYTKKKIRYLGQFQNTKYQEILNELKNREIGNKLINIDENNHDFISSIEKDEMEQSLLNLIHISI
jgi:hypothetical protein